METIPNYSSFCCPTYHVETEKSCCGCGSSHKGIYEKTGEESPLKKDAISGGEAKSKSTKISRALIFFLVALILPVIGLFIFNVVASKQKTALSPGKIDSRLHGAVATDYGDCSRIGTDLLKEGGNAVDAAVAAAICIGVVAPHKTGLGGGGRMMIYSHRDKKNPLIVDFASNTREGFFANAKVRVPAFLRGLEFAQSLRGNLPWKKIVEPSIKLAEDGFLVSKGLAYETAKSDEHAMIYGPLTAGGMLKLPDLAKTLEAVAQFSCEILYNGSLSKDVVHDEVVKKKLLQQLANYEPLVRQSKKMIFHNYVVYLPENENSIEKVIGELKKLKISETNAWTIESQILMARSVIRKLMEDRKILKTVERERYSSVIAMDAKDNYVSIVTGLSAPLGLAHMVKAGFLLDDVKTENTLDSLTPIIFHDEKHTCKLRGVFGTDDPAVAAQILYNLVLRRFNVSTSIEYPRFYAMSDGVAIEIDESLSTNSDVQVELKGSVPASRTNVEDISKSINVITKYGESLASHSDSRGGGEASEY